MEAAASWQAIGRDKFPVGQSAGLQKPALARRSTGGACEQRVRLPESKTLVRLR